MGRPVKDLPPADRVIADIHGYAVVDQMVAEMDRQHISVKGLALLMNTERSAIYKLFKRPERSSLESLQRVATALGCELRIELVSVVPDGARPSEMRADLPSPRGSAAKMLANLRASEARSRGR